MSIEVNATEHPISAVTVYQNDGALVLRRFPVTLQSGRNEIKITHLSKHISNDSIRIEAESTSSSQNLVIFDVTSTAPSSVDPNPIPDDEEWEPLSEKRDGLSAKIHILEKQQDTLEKYREEIKPTRSGGSALFEPDHLERFLDIYASKRATLDEELVKLRKERDSVLRQLSELKDKASAANLAKTMPSVKIVMSVEEDGDATLILNYIVGQASWSSLYDVRAELPKATSGKGFMPSLQVQYRASIRQTTGEDWDNVDLTLSTALPTLVNGGTIPTLSMIRIAPIRPRYTVDMVMESMSEMISDEIALADAASLEENELGDATSLGRVDRGPAVTVKEAGLSLIYEIDGKSSIPSDTNWHRVLIANLDLAAELEWIAVPRMATSAFLRCQILNSSTYEFIKGPGSVFIDGNFTSKTQIPSVSPGESFSCSLGVDPSLRITYHPRKRIATSSSAGLMAALFTKEENQVVTFRQRITIKNTLGRPVPRLIVQDQVPVSENSKLKVTMHQPGEKGLGPLNPLAATTSLGASAATSAAGATLTANIAGNVDARWAQKSDEKRGSGGSRGDGVIEWICTDLLDTVDLELLYDVSAPRGMMWA
ncbi:hypothetical protein DL93DRAFT_2162173 [Clavulina sp. PMI_390]|nr:hypothetical protein DL93DRAFT_2162173 [Clavulina sp. PMI_390]